MPRTTVSYLHVRVFGACRAGLPGEFCKSPCPLQQNGYDCGMYVLGARPQTHEQMLGIEHF